MKQNTNLHTHLVLFQHCEQYIQQLNVKVSTLALFNIRYFFAIFNKVVQRYESVSSIKLIPTNYKPKHRKYKFGSTF